MAEPIIDTEEPQATRRLKSVGVRVEEPAVGPVGTDVQPNQNPPPDLNATTTQPTQLPPPLTEKRQPVQPPPPTLTPDRG